MLVSLWNSGRADWDAWVRGACGTGHRVSRAARDSGNAFRHGGRWPGICFVPDLHRSARVGSLVHFMFEFAGVDNDGDGVRGGDLVEAREGRVADNQPLKGRRTL